MVALYPILLLHRRQHMTDVGEGVARRVVTVDKYFPEMQHLHIATQEKFLTLLADYRDIPSNRHPYIKLADIGHAPIKMKDLEKSSKKYRGTCFVLGSRFDFRDIFNAHHL